ncbi:hypothetical protein ACWPMX_00070 [Tsuneonella sp. HG094]
MPTTDRANVAPNGDRAVVPIARGCLMERTIAGGRAFTPSTVSLMNPDDGTVRLLMASEAFAGAEGPRTDVMLAQGRRNWGDGEALAMSVGGRPALLFNLPADFLAEVEDEKPLAVTMAGEVRGTLPSDGAEEAIRRLTACVFGNREN